MSHHDRCDLCGKEAYVERYMISMAMDNPPTWRGILGYPFFKEDGELCHNCKKKVTKFYLDCEKNWRVFKKSL